MKVTTTVKPTKSTLETTRKSPLAAIDIAGPDYEQYNRVSNEMTTHPAKRHNSTSLCFNERTNCETYEDTGGMNVMGGIDNRIQ